MTSSDLPQRARTKRRAQMCPNESCPHHGQRVTLMGGCECGTALVPYRPPYAPPSDDQLENFIHALMVGEARRMGLHASDGALAFAVGITMLDPAKKAMWLERHREMQEEAWAA